MAKKKISGAEEFQEDAKRIHEEYEALGRDIAATLPYEEWPRWLKNRMRPPDPRLPGDPRVKDLPGDLTLPDSWGKTADMGWFKKEEPSRVPDLEWESGTSFEIPSGVNVHDPNRCSSCGRLKDPNAVTDHCPICGTPYSQTTPDPEVQKSHGFHPTQYSDEVALNFIKPLLKVWMSKRPGDINWDQTLTPQMRQWIDSKLDPTKANHYGPRMLQEENSLYGFIKTLVGDGIGGAGSGSIYDPKKLMWEEKLVPRSKPSMPGQYNPVSSWNPFKKSSKVAQSPAVYSEDDPLDMGVVQEMVTDLSSEWWLESPQRQRQAIANAFRAALVSPRQNLYWNAVVYQHLMEVPPEESDPDVFEQLIRKRKGQWDSFGQQTIDHITENSTDPDLIQHVQNGGVAKYMPGIWGNIRNCALIGPYIEQLRQAALADVAQGGDGNLFRQQLMEMNITGIGPKIAAFVWLILCPKTSRLATIDIHMMRHLGEQAESPKDYSAYRGFEQKLDQQRQDMGYGDVPLGAFQWALWDRQRTPGWHQDHTALRALDPVDYRHIDWAPQARTRKTPVVEVSPDQQSLFDQTPTEEATNPQGWKILQ